MEDAQAFFLDEDALTELVKATHDEWNGSRIRAPAERVFPSVFVVAGARTKKGRGVRRDSVVEIGLKTDAVD